MDRFMAFFTLFWSVVTNVHCYNIEARDYDVISPNFAQNGSFYGYKIIAVKTKNGFSLYATAPNHRSNLISPMNVTSKPDGAVYRCDVTEDGREFHSTCIGLEFEDEAATGMALVKSMEDSFLVCGSQYEYNCPAARMKQRMIGACYNVTETAREGFTYMTQIKNPCQTECPGGLDLMVLWDGSSSLTLPFNTMKQWLRAIVRGFEKEIDSREIAIGLIQYSGTSQDINCKVDLHGLTRVELQLDTYNHHYVQDTIDLLTLLRGCTLTGYAINQTIQQFSTGGRQDSGRVMLVVTDGESYDDVKAVSDHARSLNISMIAVGVGSRVDVNELREIADNENTTISVSFDELDDVLNLLNSQIREAGALFIENAASSDSSNELTQCQLGQAAFVSKEDHIYLGAVGAYSGSGRIFQVEDGEATVLDNISTSLKYSYYGSSFAKGNFFQDGDTWLASGAPAYKGYGAVYITKEHAEPTSHILSPPQDDAGVRKMGAYFGYCLLSVDLNNDGKDELLVGAPLYSTHSYSNVYDEGRVFVHIFEGVNSINSSNVNYISTEQSASRFGSSLTLLGDVDYDDYTDFAVGAPHEDDGIGAIYVYYGGIHFTKENFDSSTIVYQRIPGTRSSHSKSLFGSSIAGLFLDDGNPLLFASSIGQKSTCVFRFRPVAVLNFHMGIQIDSKPSFSSPNVTLDIVRCYKDALSNISCGTVTFCSSLNWNNEQLKTSDNRFADVDFVLTLDQGVSEIRRRGEIVDENSKSLGEFRRTISVSTNEICTSVNLTLREDLLHGQQLVDVDTAFTITLAANSTNDEVNTPVITSGPTKQDKIHLNKGCRQADSCYSDLTIEGDFIDPHEIYLQKRNQIIEAVALVKNNEDPVLNVRVDVKAENLLLIRIESACAKLQGGVIDIITKTFGRMMVRGDECEITFFFIPLENVHFGNVTTFAFTISVAELNSDATPNEDVNKIDNEIVRSRPGTYKNTMKVENIDVQPQNYFYERREKRNKIVQTLKDVQLGRDKGFVAKTYAVTNEGPFLLQSSSVVIQWPAYFGSNPLLYLYKFSCNPPKNCICNTTELETVVNEFGFPLYELHEREENQTGHTTISTPIENVTSPPVTLNQVSYKIFYPRTSPFKYTFVDCNSRGVGCHSIKCSIHQLDVSQKIQAVAKFKVWIPTLKLKPNVSSLFIGSEVVVDNKQPNVKNRKVITQHAYIETFQILHDIPMVEGKFSINLTSLLLALLAGVVILAILIIVCWKCGFFKSKFPKIREQDLDWASYDSYVKARAVYEEGVRQLNKPNVLRQTKRTLEVSEDEEVWASNNLDGKFVPMKVVSKVKVSTPEKTEVLENSKPAIKDGRKRSSLHSFQDTSDSQHLLPKKKVSLDSNNIYEKPLPADYMRERGSNKVTDIDAAIATSNNNARHNRRSLKMARKNQIPF